MKPTEVYADCEDSEACADSEARVGRYAEAVVALFVVCDDRQTLAKCPFL